MPKLADEERQLLRYYGERERVVSGLQRTINSSGAFGPWLHRGTVGKSSGPFGRRDGNGSKGFVISTLIAPMAARHIF
jgi:hypothetical protein